MRTKTRRGNCSNKPQKWKRCFMWQTRSLTLPVDCMQSRLVPVAWGEVRGWLKAGALAEHQPKEQWDPPLLPVPETRSLFCAGTAAAAMSWQSKMGCYHARNRGLGETCAWTLRMPPVLASRPPGSCRLQDARGWLPARRQTYTVRKGGPEKPSVVTTLEHFHVLRPCLPDSHIPVSCSVPHAHRKLPHTRKPLTQKTETNKKDLGRSTHEIIKWKRRRLLFLLQYSL